MAEGESGRLQLTAVQRRLAVLGSPISHSRSPALHLAAYERLGLPWSYEAVDVAAGGLADFTAGLGSEWRGLSLTMPLKREVLALLDTVEPMAILAGAANTLVLEQESGRRILRGFNTDVHGVIEALRGGGIVSVASARILGGGATAASVLIALSKLGAGRVAVSVRSPQKLGELIAIAEQLDIDLSIETLGGQQAEHEVDVVVSTLPNGTVLELPRASAAAPFALDVAYDPWPSSLATAWIAEGSTVISGLEMLAHQALGQVRIFVGGAADVALPNESAVFAAMRAAVGLPTHD